MDMKVAGTQKGFTAIQADIKTSGIPIKVIAEGLTGAHDAKNKILNIMSSCLSSPRLIRKHCWPVTEIMSIEPHQRMRLIGPGGMNVKKLFLETGANMTQINESKFSIFAPSEEAMKEAKEHIQELLKEDEQVKLEFGGVYNAKIVEVKDIGVMITFWPSMQPVLLHLSQLDNRRVGIVTSECVT